MKSVKFLTMSRNMHRQFCMHLFFAKRKILLTCLDAENVLFRDLFQFRDPVKTHLRSFLGPDPKFSNTNFLYHFIPGTLSQPLPTSQTKWSTFTTTTTTARIKDGDDFYKAIKNWWCFITQTMVWQPVGFIRGSRCRQWEGGWFIFHLDNFTPK